jgi:alpha-1,3-mannosyl-glycoprotein beta-1,2-N-acetylglucosaminyltransferase
MSRIRYVFIFLVIACLVWFLLTVNQAFESADKKLHEYLDFRLDNFDARNVRQLNDLKEEVSSLRSKVDKLLAQGSEGDTGVGHLKETTSAIQTPTTTGDDVKKSVIPREVSRPGDTVILIITCNRVEYLKRTLEQVLEKKPTGSNQVSVVVSQDCNDPATSNYLEQQRGKVKIIKQPDLGPIAISDPKEKKMEGYYKISRHFKFALKQAFEVLGYEYVIIIEDDLDISSDFFSYFIATKRLLAEDPSIWCVSAWNDNGKDGYVSGSEILYRSDFFPGLGWMMKKSIWEELGPKWPASYWDDWMREPSQRKDRVCIRPEICRAKTFGYKGVSKGEFSPFLKLIKLNDLPVDFSTVDLSYLKQERFDHEFLSRVYSAPELHESEVISGARSELKEVRVTYSGQKHFISLGKRLGIMTDWKAGVPRAAYKGIVTIFFRNRRLYITPPKGV